MTRDEYGAILLSKGFVFVESQEAWTQHRGQEDKYTHPGYGNYFYIKRISDEDGSPWGFNAQAVNGRKFDNIYPHNAVDTFRDKGQFMWVGDSFVELMRRLIIAKSWVVSSIPSTYDAKKSLMENGEMDWVTKNNFMIGDTVYIYEVIPPRGRGGIVYKTEVIKTNFFLEEKLDDRNYWAGQTYPKSLTEQTTFSRLKLLGEPSGEVITLESLKEFGFTAPQGLAYRIAESLEEFVESFFQAAIDSENDEIANKISLNDNLSEVTQALEALSSHLPPNRIKQVVHKVARNPKIARLVKEREFYICEICGRRPFIQKNGQPYAEADHIEPLGGASKGLDTPENIRCLCAQCHAIITYGSDEVIKELRSSGKLHLDNH